MGTTINDPAGNNDDLPSPSSLLYPGGDQSLRNVIIALLPNVDISASSGIGTTLNSGNDISSAVLLDNSSRVNDLYQYLDV